MKKPQPRTIDMFDDYPNSPGYSEGTTSKEAAKSAAVRAKMLRKRALAVITLTPATADEIAEVINESVLSVRPRITELQREGLIEKSGKRRKNKSGCTAHVWRIVKC